MECRKSFGVLENEAKTLTVSLHVPLTVYGLQYYCVAVTIMLCVRSWCGITGNWRLYLSTSHCSRAPSQPRTVTPGLGEVGGKPLWGNVGV